MTVTGRQDQHNDNYGRVSQTGDPRRPLAIVGDDDANVAPYDSYLALRSRDLCAGRLYALAVLLLLWQRHLWRNPGIGDLRMEAAALALDAADARGARVGEGLRKALDEFLDFCEQRDLVHALFLAPAEDFAALLNRSSASARLRAETSAEREQRNQDRRSATDARLIETTRGYLRPAAR